MNVSSVNPACTDPMGDCMSWRAIFFMPLNHMNRTIVIAAVLLLALATVLKITATSAPMVWHPSSITGSLYWVKNVQGKEAVADRLATLQIALTKFIKDAQVLVPGDARIQRLVRKWDGTVAEVERPGDIAYSLNKRAIHVCVRGTGGALESLNTTMYVFLHEVAHVLTLEWGHPEEYWNNFRWVLEVAEQTGTYTYEDFDAIPVTHCGHRLGANALSCVRRKECASSLRKKA